jgi:muramidase (phage lysozyme)
MYGVNNKDKVVLPEKEPIDRLKELIKFMEHQSTLDYLALPQTEVTEPPPKGSKAPPKISKHEVTTEEIIAKMINKTFTEPATKAPSDSIRRCARYVKVGLWYAGYGPATESIGPKTGVARLMGPELVKAGFADIGPKLPKIKISVGKKVIEQPDITFALPGDVIVYKKTAAPSEAGHIDLRTYHSFVSDFFWGPARNCFPNVRHYTVTGVYRKYSDTLAEARVKAFLRIIREHMTNGFDDPYLAHKLEGEKHIGFTDTTKHPYAASGEDKPAGAYQIKWRTFDRYQQTTGWPASFTPVDQDRAAIYELQGKPATENHPKRTALGYIMEGKVEQAVNDTKLWNPFTFLPGGKQQLISMDELKKTFDTYTAEFSK